MKIFNSLLFADGFIFLLISLSPSHFEKAIPIQNLFIIWNIGQGQSTTYVSSKACYHFDLGGEKYPSKIMKYCQKKENLFFLSHTDWDHMNFLPRASKNLRFCLHSWPQGNSSPQKLKTLKNLKLCSNSQLGDFRQKVEVYTPSPMKTFKNNNNALSRVALLFQKILIPGDSPISQEKEWILKIQNPQRIQVLILGHHGSRTSTSKELLDYLPFLKMAIATARFNKYGHPHEETLARLKVKKIPILRTEEWGNIILELGY